VLSRGAARAQTTHDGSALRASRRHVAHIRDYRVQLVVDAAVSRPYGEDWAFDVTVEVGVQRAVHF
jgi:hypothetical protein